MFRTRVFAGFVETGSLVINKNLRKNNFNKISLINRQNFHFSIKRNINNQYKSLSLFKSADFTRSTHSISNVEKNLKEPKMDTELSAFDDVFTEFSTTIRKELELKNLKEVADWIEKGLYYNVPHGKKNRGIALVKTFQIVASDTELTAENLNLARLLGWCVEMLQAFLIILDDVMDKSLTRRGQDCWYRIKGVGFNAINDAVLMDQAIYIILKRHFSHLPCYLDLIETFHDVTLWTSSGQSLDMLSTPIDTKPNLTSYTPERYDSIVIHKTAYYTIYLPVKLGVILAGKKEAFTKEVEDILLSIGHYFQVQDDILDCFGDPKITGKIGTDIEDAKCSWPIVTAYKQATPQDKLILEENYGVNSEEAVSKVKNIYNKLGILSQFESYELEIYNQIAKRVQEVTEKSDIPAMVFFGLLDKIYKRKK